MEQCLRVLERIQPATIRQWKAASWKEQEQGGAPCRRFDNDVLIEHCVRSGYVVCEHGHDTENPETRWILGAALDQVLAHLDKDVARERERRLPQYIESGQWQFIPNRSPVYVIRAPAWITSEEREQLHEILKALGGGFIIPDTVTIEEY